MSYIDFKKELDLCWMNQFGGGMTKNYRSQLNKLKQDLIKLKMLEVHWECPHCGDKITSYKYIRHSLNMCSCGKCGVDAEMYYIRMLGDPIVYGIS